MELIYIAHGNLLHLHVLSTPLSLVVVIGGVYAFLRLLVVDVLRGLSAVVRNLTEPPVERKAPPGQ